MIPTLIVLGLLGLGVAIVAFATRRPPGQPLPVQSDRDTAWNDAFTPAGESSADDPFAHAPAVSSDPAPVLEETRP